MQTLAKQNRATAPNEDYRGLNAATVHRLTDDDKDEVLSFLAARPVHTFGLTGFVRDNGLVSPHNRGTFYACRDDQGLLEGVALIGHFILFEARSERAIEAFARIAQGCSNAFMLLGEQDDVRAFWHYYSPEGQQARLSCRELLFVQKWPIEVLGNVRGLRLATPDDLDMIVPAHAETALIESGVNPLEVDPEGFRRRCARRIEMGKTWVLVENSKLMFKAEIVSDTPDVVYVEGVWVNPDDRGKGHGSRCMSQLGMIFLQRTRSVCVLVNEDFKAAQASYRKAGYKFIAYYETIFLRQVRERDEL
ncbi:MAG TPA: GNAT family N-acetyltransferase [Blastocatellia bacterium]|jgi:predicted GNAT family acetyltransferase|nr:GNAT family N-acetyltransferase [Blastocatellia bacterium]